MTVSPRVVASLFIVLVTTLLLSGCGSKDEGPPTVRVDGTEMMFEPEAIEVGAGLTRLEFRNRGSLAHNIVFRDADGAPTASGEDEFVPAGNNQSFEFELVAGEYGFYCSVPGHEAAGMVGTLVVG